MANTRRTKNGSGSKAQSSKQKGKAGAGNSRGRKRNASESAAEDAPPAKKLATDLTDAEKMAIFKEVSRQEQVRKKTEHSKETQGTGFFFFQKNTLICPI
jgi:hypothetical protein